jgi:hypothetical protein
VIAVRGSSRLCHGIRSSLSDVRFHLHDPTTDESPDEIHQGYSMATRVGDGSMHA